MMQAMPDERVPAALPAEAAARLGRLMADGFELQKDLTGRQPIAFEGGYQDWYSTALALVAQLLPDRRADFEALYAPKRRRIDIETYGIRDYLLGLSLHGGYGPLDAMRAIAARRFHQQLMILRSAEAALAPGLHRLEAMAVASLTEEHLAAAESLAEAAPNAASACLVALLRTRLARIARARSAIRPPAPETVVLSLAREGVISPEQALLCRTALRCGRPGGPELPPYHQLKEAVVLIAIA